MPSFADAAHAVLAGNRNQRAGRTRSTEPALLRGLIFTETGAAMTPHHTKKGNRRYCYYVSMDVIQKRPTAELRGPQRLPAARWRKRSSARSGGCCARRRSLRGLRGF
ncbi:MAG: hypothetical protein ACE368_14420 [Paracoccaceae bacterium]